MGWKLLGFASLLLLASKIVGIALVLATGDHREWTWYLRQAVFGGLALYVGIVALRKARS